MSFVSTKEGCQPSCAPVIFIVVSVLPWRRKFMEFCPIGRMHRYIRRHRHRKILASTAVAAATVVVVVRRCSRDIVVTVVTTFTNSLPDTVVIVIFVDKVLCCHCCHCRHCRTPLSSPNSATDFSRLPLKSAVRLSQFFHILYWPYQRPYRVLPLVSVSDCQKCGCPQVYFRKYCTRTDRGHAE